MDDPIRRNWPIVPPTLEPGPGLRWEPNFDVWDDFWRKNELHKMWTTNSGDFTGRAPSFYKPENVIKSGFSLVLRATNENPDAKTRAAERNNKIEDETRHYKKYATAFVRTQKPMLYGYIEICARLRHSQISSGFWLTNNEGGGWWTGIDVFHYSIGHDSNLGNRLHTSTHVHRFGHDLNLNMKPLSSPKVVRFNENLSERPHRFAIDWSPQKITWFVDGIPIRSESNEHHHRPLYITFDSQTFPLWFGLPDHEGLNGNGFGDFEIFYIRTWNRVPNLDDYDGIAIVPDKQEQNLHKRKVSFRDFNGV